MCSGGRNLKVWFSRRFLDKLGHFSCVPKLLFKDKIFFRLITFLRFLLLLITSFTLHFYLDEVGVVHHICVLFTCSSGRQPMWKVLFIRGRFRLLTRLSKWLPCKSWHAGAHFFPALLMLIVVRSNRVNLKLNFDV